MGVLKGSLISLKNGNKKKIEDISRKDIINSCNIQGLTSMASNNVTMSWCQENPIIIRESTQVTHKWKEDIYNYRVINNKLKISYDSLVLFKDDDNVTSWGYSKSLRKGYFLFNDKYEYEEIKSIKRVEETTESICLSVYPNSYYFVDGYLIHNVYLCDACDTCKYFPTLWQWYGPHTHDSTALPVSNSYGHGYTQAQLNAVVLILNSKIWNNSNSSWDFLSTSPHVMPWNYFSKTINLRYGSTSVQSTPSVSGTYLAYYVTKYWDKSNSTVPTTSNNSMRNLGPGWVAWRGRKDSSFSSFQGDGLAAAKQLITDGYGVPTDPWYHHGYAGLGELTVNARLIYTGTSGATAWVTSDEGTTWTEITANTDTSVLTGAGGGYIDINEDTMGGQGNSKIYIIYKFPLPNTTITSSLSYNLRWMLSTYPVYAFTEHTFTNGGQTGRLGPSLSQVRTDYGTSGFWQNTSFLNTSSGFQCWKCPFTGVYEVTGLGAAGGDTTYKLGGHGARITAKFQLIGGEWYWIVVGQKGTHGNNVTGAGGGGGTFFIRKPYRNPHSLAPSLHSSQFNKNTHFLLAAGGGAGGHALTSSGPDGEGGRWNQNTPPTFLSQAWVEPTFSDHGGASGGGSSSLGYGAGGGAGLTDSGDVNGRNATVDTHGKNIFNNFEGGNGQTFSSSSNYITTDGGFGGGGAGDYHASGGGGGVYGGDSAVPYNGGAEGGGTLVRHYYDDANQHSFISSNAYKGDTSYEFSGGHGFVKIKYLGSDFSSPGCIIPRDESEEYSFSSHTFTNGGKVGRLGPSLGRLKNSYGSSGFWQNSNYFGTASNSGTGGGIQWWKVPATDLYDIDVYGAQGGGNHSIPDNGGRGARIKSRFALTKGEYLWIIVGQKGGQSTHNHKAGGGGGGSFVIKPPKNSTDWNERVNNTGRHLLIAAGGGGGSGGSGVQSNLPVGGHGQGNSVGTYASLFTGGAQGTSYSAGGGGGFLERGGGGTTSGISRGGEGARDPSGNNHFRGGQKGQSLTDTAGEGGFGGGGGGSAHAPGGGGGAWGGAGGATTSNSTGGSSYSYNTPSVQTSGARQGHGQIIITAVNTPKTLAGGYLGDSNIDPNGWFSAQAMNGA